MIARFQRLDARYIVLLNNTILLFAGRQVLGLQRAPWQIVSAFVAAILVELSLAYTTNKHGNLRLGDRVLSSSVAAVSTLVLLRSEHTWFYALAVAVAVGSKYLLVDPSGRHIFNPTDFAIVFLLSFFPQLIFIRPDQFPTFIPLLFLIIGLGIAATVRAQRWAVSLGYYAVVLGMGLPVGHLLGYRPIWVLGPELNTSTLIFAGFMMTDPKTSPSTRQGQLLFGGAIATIHLYLRYRQIPFSPFIALFFVTMVRSLRRPA